MATGTEGLEADGAQPGTASSRGVSNRVLILLVWLVAASGALLLLWGSKLTFLLDDWEFLVYRRPFDAKSILEPHGEHIVVLPMLIYKALLATFGMSSAFPFRIVSTALFLLSAVLLFVLLKRRVGEWAALAATTVVLFLGAAGEDLLWDFQMGYFGCMAAGLGALLALERDDRRGDVLASVLLVLALLFSDLAIPFMAAVLVLILLREDRWQRIWILAAPVVVYVIWWVGWGHNAESAISLSTLSATPVFVLNGLSATLASLTGLALPSSSNAAGGLEWGRVLLALVAVATGWWLHRIGRMPRWAWITLALVGSFWILAGVNQEPGREPDSSRYQYIGVVFFLLFAAELLRGLNFSRRALWAIFGVALICVLPNLHMLHNTYQYYRNVSQLEKADLAALDITADTVRPYFTLSKRVAGTPFIHIEAGPYLEAAEEFGSPGYSLDELAEAPKKARYNADKVMFGALAARLIELPPSELPDVAPTVPAAGESFVEVPADGCVVVKPGTGSPQLALPPGGVILGAGEAPIEEVKIARYASGKFPIIDHSGVGAGQVAEVRIPADRSPALWQMKLRSNSAATACGVEAAGE